MTERPGTSDTLIDPPASAIAATVRAGDMPARHGDEAFAVILRRASAPQATEVAERVRRAVAAMPPQRSGVDLPGPPRSGSRWPRPTRRWSR